MLQHVEEFPMIALLEENAGEQSHEVHFGTGGVGELLGGGKIDYPNFFGSRSG